MATVSSAWGEKKGMGLAFATGRRWGKGSRVRVPVGEAMPAAQHPDPKHRYLFLRPFLFPSVYALKYFMELEAQMKTNSPSHISPSILNPKPGTSPCISVGNFILACCDGPSPTPRSQLGDAGTRAQGHGARTSVQPSCPVLWSRVVIEHRYLGSEGPFLLSLGGS